MIEAGWREGMIWNHWVWVDYCESNYLDLGETRKDINRMGDNKMSKSQEKRSRVQNEKWRGKGFCKARSIKAENDYCNRPVVANSEYCRNCICWVKGCKEKGVIEWPMEGGVKLCSQHYSTPPPKYASLVTASKAPPDDFDYPEDW